MKYRNRTEIVCNILEASYGGATKSKIMYNAYLSYNQLMEYLTILIESSLIEYDNGTLNFKTTEKGLRFLLAHNEIGELLHTTIGNDNEII